MKTLHFRVMKAPSLPSKWAWHLILLICLTNTLYAGMINFHWGSVTQTGSAAMGMTGDIWGASTLATGTTPLTLNDVNGDATTVSMTWVAGTAGYPGALADQQISQYWNPYDAATAGLMQSYLTAYQYSPSGSGAITFSLSGLAANAPYTLVLYGAGLYQGSDSFVVTGSGTSTGTVSGTSRKISAGSGVAYTRLNVKSSSTGTLAVRTSKTGTVYLNGFQITGGLGTGMQPFGWGACGHPTWSDYANWNPANIATQLGYLQQLGCNFYRCSFEYSPNSYPGLMANIVPQAQAVGITVLPILPLQIVAANGTNNYGTNYTIGTTWATYAINHGYNLPYWELGNELENWGLINVAGDGSSPNNITDKVAGGFVSIASALNGAYDGISDTYATARASGSTTITPQMLFGATWRHWGLLTKIKNYNGTAPVPWDIISWHWYTPNYNDFTAVITDTTSYSYGRTPVACLNDFKQQLDPSQPMDIWITEIGRSQNVVGQGFTNGSCTSATDPENHQDWNLQAQTLGSEIDNLMSISTVKAIIVFELFNETINYAGSSDAGKASAAYFGLLTGLNGSYKDAFYMYQTKISQYGY